MQGHSDDVDEIVAKGPKDVLKRYFPLQWLNCPLYDGGGGGGNGGGGCGGGGGGGFGGGGGESAVDV